MMKTSRRSLSYLIALSCLSACDPAYNVPVEVHFSEDFLAQWGGGYPVEVGIRSESAENSSVLPLDAWGSQLGALCTAPSGPVKLQTTLHELGCVPKELQVTVWIAPDSKPMRGACVQPTATDGGTPDGGPPQSCKPPDGADAGLPEGCATPGPRPLPDGHYTDTDTLPEQGITRTAKAKILSCTKAERIVLEF